MWKEIESKLEEIEVEKLGFDHPLCYDSLKPIVDISEDFRKMFSEWNSPEILQEITYRLLDTLTINEGTYVCDVLSPLLDIVMNDLPVNTDVWIEWIGYLETGRPESTSDKQSRDHKKLNRISKDSIDSIRKPELRVTIYKILNTKDNEDSSDSDETKSTVSTPPSTPRSSTVVHSHHSQE
ncbi:18102_t:CDS:2 [Gigaspora margarita]|uniref:18102_t:CDS:1 n=1 Tax=Gigaspora margarita TaxID=4874 RepID=A0ABN7V0E4_GIGMA|nr:18102_t:CDS:2 [Gigaspora margarita]